MFVFSKFGVVEGVVIKEEQGRLTGNGWVIFKELCSTFQQVSKNYARLFSKFGVVEGVVIEEEQGRLTGNGWVIFKELCSTFQQVSKNYA
jgi:hypothetical protein